MGEIRPLHLENLPNEVLSSIIRFADLERRPSQNNAFNLMLCSSCFHALAEPILYDHVVLHSLRSLPPFVCKLLARPAYAKRLQLVCATAHSDELNTFSLSSADRNGISVAINQVTHSQEDASKWLSGIKNRAWDAFMALLLVLAPNIREIQLDQWGGSRLGRSDNYPFIFEVVKRVAVDQRCGENSPLALRRFQKLSLKSWCQDPKYAIDIVTPFLALPSLSSVNLVGLKEVPNFSAPPSIISPFRSTVSDLSFHGSLISSHIMPDFFSNFTCLERFHYCCDNLDGYIRRSLQLEPPRLMAGLNQLKLFLKELTVLDEHVRHKKETFEYADLVGRPCKASELAKCPIGSFGGFHKLTHICATASVMMGDGSAGTAQGFDRSQRLVSAVPPALQSLTLKKCDENTASNLFELVSQKETWAPQLKYLDLDWKTVKLFNGRLSTAGPLIHPGFTREQAHELILLCQKAKIELKIHAKFPPPKKFVCKVGPPGSENLQYYGTVVIEYPYTNYEQLCREYGCDPATGKPPGPGEYPPTHVDSWPAEFFEE